MMTRDEWLAAYYPTPAEDCPKEDAVAHSIRKWEGIVQAVQDGGAVPIRTDASTCALCVHFYETNLDGADVCTDCPLAMSLGRRCDEDNDDGIPPWNAYYNGKDPFPMLNALKSIEP